MKKKGLGVLLLTAILTFSGCGAGESTGMKATNDFAAAEVGGEYVQTNGIYNEYSDVAFEAESTAPESVREGRKLIRTANLTVETLEFDNLLDNLKNKANSLGGYAETYTVNNGSNYNSSYYSGTSAYRSNRTAYIVYRIPKNKMDDFLGEVAEKGNVVKRNEQESDVTTQYVDLESHKATLKVEQERLMALLEEAYSLDDMLTIEDRLSDIRYELENIERSIRSYDSQIDYSTVTLNINEVIELTPVEVKEESTWERISGGFVQSLKNIWAGLVEFFILFIIALPYLALIGIIIAIFVCIIVLIVKSATKKQEKRMAKEREKQARNAQAQMQAYNQQMMRNNQMPQNAQVAGNNQAAQNAQVAGNNQAPQNTQVTGNNQAPGNK